MSVLVLSCGRTGTNMTLELLMGSPSLECRQREERSLFINPREIVDGSYLEKSDVVYVPSTESIKQVMDMNKNLKIVWTVRDFRDVIMSKLYRGRAGGEGRSVAVYDLDSVEKDLRWMKECYDYLYSSYPDRLFVVKMEDTILDPDSQSIRLCKSLNIQYSSSMQNFHLRTRLETKLRRYKNKIDKSQVGLWKRMDSAYNGYFKDYNFGVLLEYADKLNSCWGYE